MGIRIKSKKTDLRTSVLTNINNGETLTVAGVDFGKGAKNSLRQLLLRKKGMLLRFILIVKMDLLSASLK